MSNIASGNSALETAKKNTHRAWMVGKGGTSAKDRFTSGEYFSVRHIPKFTISRESPIFTMGSCFAREIESTLLAQRIPIVLDGHGVPPEEFETWNEETGIGGGVYRGKLSRGAYNKYTVHSMSHEIRRVLLNEQFEDDGLIEIDTGRWFDPHASGTRSGSYDHISAVRGGIHDGMAQIKNAKVVFLTLGLVEGWFDNQTGLAMNRIPPALTMARLSDRFSLKVPSFGEMVSELSSTIELIRRTCFSDMHFIITVSPVPFGATFKDLDVVVANTSSKSLLRAAADEIVQTLDFVDYFPSYEIVINSPRVLAWEDDQLHVRPKMVRHVTSFFSDKYFQP